MCGGRAGAGALDANARCSRRRWSTAAKQRNKRRRALAQENEAGGDKAVRVGGRHRGRLEDKGTVGVGVGVGYRLVSIVEERRCELVGVANNGDAGRVESS